MPNQKQLARSDIAKLPHRRQVMLALFCAKQVIHLATDERAKIAVETVERWLEGKASVEECRKAAAAADAAYAAGAAYAADAAYAAYAAGGAAGAAADAAYAAGAADAAYAAAAGAAAYATAYAGDAAGKDKDARARILQQQWDYYDQLLNEDRYFEEIVLGDR